MKAYMYYSGAVGPTEAALLVFANSAREAKKVGWNNDPGICRDDYGGWLDARVKQLHGDHITKQAVSSEPHVVTNPESCSLCEQWGMELVGDVCESCWGTG